MNIYREFKRLHRISLKGISYEQQLKDFKSKVEIIMNSNNYILTFFWERWKGYSSEEAWNDFLNMNKIEKSLENLIRLGYYD